MSRLRVLIGCECSGAVRRAFRARGHDAWSCDLKPAEDGSPFHIQGDLLGHLNDGWDIGIFHPVCRYLANSGAKHLYAGMKKENGPNEQRWRDMREGAEFFKFCLNAPIPRIAVENPVMHGHAAKIIGVKPSQIIHPWQYGHKETKATCLWLKGLPKLVPANVVGPPPKDPQERKSWERVFRAPPGPNREADRSRTLEGIAGAMAAQWSEAVLQRDLFEAAA
jgi:hypothetical protein